MSVPGWPLQFRQLGGVRRYLPRFIFGKLGVYRKQSEDKVAKSQLRSSREKKKPKAEKNKKKSAPAASPFTLVTGRDASGKKFS